MPPSNPRSRLIPSRQHLYRLMLAGLFCLSLGLGLLVNHHPARSTEPAVSGVEQQVQQGVERYQQGDFQGAIAPWQAALEYYQQHPNPANEAIVLENLARTYQSLGQTSAAIATWQQVTEHYRQLQSRPSAQSTRYQQQLGRSLTEQAQAYMRIGQSRKAAALLCGSLGGLETCTEGSALAIAQATADLLGQTAALGSLGQVHRIMGDYEQSNAYLNAALASAQQLGDPVLEAATYSDLGATASSQALVRYRQARSAEPLGDLERASSLNSQGQKFDQAALQYFQQSLARQIPPLNQVRVTLALIPVYDRTGMTTAAQQARQQAQQLLSRLPNTQEKVLATIDLAQMLVPTSARQPQSIRQCPGAEAIAAAEQLLHQASDTATQIGDRRSQSFALGELGRLSECRGALPEALKLTQQARVAAEREFDSRYLWEWQAGRILQQQAQPDAAIQAYKESVATLETIRDDILVANRDVQFDFRDTIEPLYRQLVNLQLTQGKPSELIPAPVENQSDGLSQVLITLDSLKLAELQNYFGNDCVLTARSVDLVAPKQLLTQGDRAAVLSTVMLDERTAVILTLPDGSRQYEWIPLSRSQLTERVNDYRRGLEIDFRRYDPLPAQRLYNLLVRPFEAVLTAEQVETLVFVQDNILRSVPMSALHDGNQFLIQRYAIAYTPSLQLTSLNPFNLRGLRALAVGLTTASPADSAAGFFAALGNVESEINAVKEQLPDSVTLTGSEFLLKNMEQVLDSGDFPILHIATHGIFGTESDDTFLVTGDRPDNKLTLTRLDHLLRQVKPERPVELLVLTACTTAVGDDRAALGLAGVAAQAGVRSVLASLWFVNDTATARLIGTFYKNVNTPQVSKARALQQAQIQLIEAEGEFSRPAYWAPFVLIGNWL